MKLRRKVMAKPQHPPELLDGKTTALSRPSNRP